MDISSVLTFKSCFLGLRAKGALDNIKNGQGYSALANAGRVAVTASQSIVPLTNFAGKVSTEIPNTFWQKIATNPNLTKIAKTIDSPLPIKCASKIPKIARFLSKLGLVANITYEFAKPLDVKESKKSDNNDKHKVCPSCLNKCINWTLQAEIKSKNSLSKNFKSKYNLKGTSIFFVDIIYYIFNLV